MQRLGLVLLLVAAVQMGLLAQARNQIAQTIIPIAEVEALQLPAQDNEVLKEAELALRTPGRAPHFAEVMPVDVSPTTHGTWETVGQTAVWRLRVPSPTAHSLNFGFDQYQMPSGGQLFLYTTDLKQIQGPFTPADNEDHGQLWTPMVLGDEVVIEVSVPLAQKEELHLHLKTVNHDFMGFGPAAAGISGSCNLDVICGAEDGWGIVDGYRDIIQSVALYGLNGSTTCTGFLVNNTRQDCTPYFMVADHCGVSAGNAPSMVVYWNYNSPTCREPGSAASGGFGNGPLTDFNTGSVFRAGYGPSDFGLVELDDPVSETANAFFAGWDVSDRLEPDTIIAIHHPSLDEKRISFAFDGIYRGTWPGAGPVADGNHLIVADWEIGTTEGGSSGSPLFDSDGRVIGQLHGGAAACFNDDYDSYGWTFFSWTGGGSSTTRLSDWLDPDNTGITQLDGRAAALCSFSATANPQTQTLCSPTSVVYEIAVGETWEDEVTLTVNNLPDGVSANFSTNTVSPGGSAQLTLTGADGLTTDSYTFQLNATDGTNSSSQTLTLNITDDVAVAPTLASPANMQTETLTFLNLSWDAVELANSYDVELATDPGFSNVIASANGLDELEFATPELDTETAYHWRVRATNLCGTGDWSDGFSFTTANLVCGARAADTGGITIGPQGNTTSTSTLEITATGEIASLSIFNLETDHTYVGDLSATLTSPDGSTTIQVFDQPNCDLPGLSVSFDDNAANSAAAFVSTCDQAGSFAIEGEFQPAQAFANFEGLPIAGTWTLEIRDAFNADGGQLLGWELGFCVDEVVNTLEIAGSTVEVFPNPTTGWVQIKLSSDLNDELQVQVFAVSGQQLRSQRLLPATSGYEMDLSDLPAGTYLLRLANEQEAVSTRVVKY